MFSKLFSGIRNWTFLKMSVFDFRKNFLEKAEKKAVGKAWSELQIK
jgi:hypothetical protein